MPIVQTMLTMSKYGDHAMRRWKLSANSLMACFMGFGNCPPPMQPLGILLQKMGMIEMRSPQQSWPIGTIVGVKRDQFGTINEIQDICTPLSLAPSLFQEGKSYIRERTSDTSELERASTSGMIDLSGVSIGDVKAGLGAEGEWITGISVVISNAFIFYAVATMLSDTADELMKNPKCVSDIAGHRQKGYEVTSLSRVLVSDLTYSVHLSRELDGNAKAALMKQVGAELKASYDQSNQSLVKGIGLTYGFRVAPVSPIAP